MYTEGILYFVCLFLKFKVQLSLVGANPTGGLYYTVEAHIFEMTTSLLHSKCIIVNPFGYKSQ